MQNTRDNGFQEAVGLVLDAQASASRLCAALGYVIRHQGPAPDGTLALMGLPQGQAGHEILIGHPQAERGDIRLIALAGEATGLMRDGARAWDAGGIFDINLRALDGIVPLHRALGCAGFSAHAPITDWDFGAVSVREVVESDSDGLCIAVMERVHPPLTGFEAFTGPASWVFNSTQVVSDFAAAQSFYRDALGWQVVQESEWTHDDGHNCMGLPLGLAPDIPVRVGIYQAQGRMEGSVEIIAFGCKVLDFSDAAPPQRGWASLRFPVRDLGNFLTRVDAGGCQTIGPVRLDWQPHGTGLAAVAITPWGARLEAFQLD